MLLSHTLLLYGTAQHSTSHVHMAFRGQARPALSISKESWKGHRSAAGLLSYPVIKALGLACCVDLLDADAGLIWMPCRYRRMPN